MKRLKFSTIISGVWGDEGFSGKRRERRKKYLVIKKKKRHTD